MFENNYDGNIDDKLSFKDEFKLHPHHNTGKIWRSQKINRKSKSQNKTPTDWQDRTQELLEEILRPPYCCGRLK